LKVVIIGVFALGLAIGASSAEIEDSWWLLCYKWALSRLGTVSIDLESEAKLYQKYKPHSFSLPDFSEFKF